jgi:hypothetical protein
MRVQQTPKFSGPAHGVEPKRGIYRALLAYFDIYEAFFPLTPIPASLFPWRAKGLIRLVSFPHLPSLVARWLRKSQSHGFKMKPGLTPRLETRDDALYLYLPESCCLVLHFIQGHRRSPGQ